MIRYARAPSPAFRALLAPGGFLSPILAPRVVHGLPVDVQLREGDHLHAYCGLTRLLDVGLGRNGVRVAADATYATQACGTSLFRLWAPNEDGFADAIDRYFAGVGVDPSWVRGEGAVQALWARVGDPWTPFDREAVLGYEDTATQVAGRVFSGIQAARDEIERIRVAGGWAAMPTGKVGAELDQLAVDPNGRLVLIELKDASASASSVYYSPFQLLQYVHEWAAAFDGVRDQLGALIDARKELGLSPPNIPDLDRGFRPVVGFGADVRSPEVRTRFELVRAVANRHLPGGAEPIEAWAMDGFTPFRLD